MNNTSSPSHVLPSHAIDRGGIRVGRRGRIQLGLCAGLIAMTWLVVLPWIAGRPGMADRLEWLEEKGIDPSAMYYTELEAMTPILDRLEQDSSKKSRLKSRFQNH